MAISVIDDDHQFSGYVEHDIPPDVRSYSSGLSELFGCPVRVEALLENELTHVRTLMIHISSSGKGHFRRLTRSLAQGDVILTHQKDGFKVRAGDEQFLTLYPCVTPTLKGLARKADVDLHFVLEALDEEKRIASSGPSRPND